MPNANANSNAIANANGNGNTNVKAKAKAMTMPKPKANAKAVQSPAAQLSMHQPTNACDLGFNKSLDFRFPHCREIDLDAFELQIIKEVDAYPPEKLDAIFAT